MCGVSLFDWVQVVAALSALVAVWFAYRAVHETRGLRREERLARLPDLIVDAGEALLSFHGGKRGERSADWLYPIAISRLRVALSFVDDPLPNCRALATSGAGVNESADPIRALVTAALYELEEAGGHAIPSSPPDLES